MANRKEGIKGVGVREFRKLGDKRAHVAHKHRLPMDTLGYFLDQYENTGKDNPKRGRLRHIINAAIAAGIDPKRIQRETELKHTQITMAANGNSPDATPAQRHALLHLVREEVQKHRATRHLPGHHFKR